MPESIKTTLTMATKFRRKVKTYPWHGLCHCDPTIMLVDGKKAGRVFAQEILEFSIISCIPVSCIDLFHPLTHHASLFNACCIMWEVENWRIVISVSNLNPKCAESSQCLAALVLSLHRNSVICDTYLGFSIKDVRCSDDTCDRINVKPITALIIWFDKRICDIAIGSSVQVNSFHLQEHNENITRSVRTRGFRNFNCMGNSV